MLAVTLTQDPSPSNCEPAWVSWAPRQTCSQQDPEPSIYTSTRALPISQTNTQSIETNMSAPQSEAFKKAVEDSKKLTSKPSNDDLLELYGRSPQQVPFLPDTHQR